MVATWRIILSTTAFVVPVTVTSLDAFGYVARVEGASMQPSLNPKETSGTDYVYLNRWAAKDFRFRRGDVVSLASPMNPEQKLIKRIIGMEGDVVRTLSYKNRYVKIPPGHCWVEGDHTGQSLDSNLFGPIAMGLITAKASAVVWPPKRMHLLESVTPSNSRVRINPEVVMATRAPVTETSTLTVEDMA